MNMLIGLIGKPNTGKSTLFKALTLAEVEIANYPFATVKPNSGVGHVRIDCVDKDFNVQCNPKDGFCLEHQRFVPVQLIDVAGLVPGAHEGKGLGNQFLDDLRQADVLIHVVDVAGTTDAEGKPVKPGSYNPAQDIKFLEEEIDLWYFGILAKGWRKFARKVQQEHADAIKAIANQFSGLKVDDHIVKQTLNKLNLKPEEIASWNDEQLKEIAVELRKRTKPMIIAANKIDIPQGREDLKKLKEQFPDYKIFRVSAESELALKEAAKHSMIKYLSGDSDFEILSEAKLNEKQKKGLEFVKKNVLEKHGSTGVQKVLNSAVLELLEYIAVFPVPSAKLKDVKGNTLPDCYLLPKNSKAIDLAYALHTDFAKNFIKGIDIRTKQVIGKEHQLKHRDVIEIITKK